MPETSPVKAVESDSIDMKALADQLTQVNRDSVEKFTRDLLVVQNRLYSQLESLSWLQRILKIKGQLPPLSGWAASPDVLLMLHNWVKTNRPKCIVEFGSGASTIVIADALRQNGIGKLFSFDHSDYYGRQTLEQIKAEGLDVWVDVRMSELEDWTSEHLNPPDAEKPSRWYSKTLLHGIENVDLLWVDGPPGATCLFSRYPALPALADKLSADAEVWMDDTIRKEEKDICEKWAKDYGFEVEYYALEKGLGRLRRPSADNLYLAPKSIEQSLISESSLGLDFSLPENRYIG